jgi:hypothetical protein
MTKTGFEWTKTKMRIARDIANGNKTIPELVDKYGISARTIYRLKQEPEFMARVRKHLRVFDQVLRKMRRADAVARYRSWQ